MNEARDKSGGQALWFNLSQNSLDRSFFVFTGIFKRNSQNLSRMVAGIVLYNGVSSAT
ncbi:hypothetical protein [Acetobacter sp. P1H12_c]|uniref:hypothetical protein n=1 Tax=Acetobacter sp. P1H12_c TaxID=2762621 RepID=UPI00207B61BB|nr:hypothetical protein [Acetobacter sp. P1H12_c]